MKFISQNSKTLILSILAIFQINLIKCDLPINCLKSQVQGEWEFEITKPIKLKSMLENHCGHQTPDKEVTSYKAMISDNRKFVTDQKFQIKLNPDGSVKTIQDFQQLSKAFFMFKQNNNFIFRQIQSSLIQSQKKQDEQQQQFWTMIYNEGFDIKLKNNISIFVFNKYFPDPQNKDRYLSNCAQTLVGWFADYNNRLYACIKGKKLNSPDIINQAVPQESVTQDNVTNIQPQFKQIVGETQNQKNNLHNDIQDKFNQDANSLRFLSNKFTQKLELSQDFKNHDEVINRMNSVVNKLWTAELDNKFKHLSISELNKKAGRYRFNNFRFSFSEERKKMQSYQQTRNSSNSSIKSQLPKSFSWEKVLPPPFEQGSCGSCYAVATLQMLESRLKIKYNTTVKLSLDHVLNCSYYNQGCDGGYPFLVNKFASELHLIEQDACKQKFTKNGFNQCQFICKNISRVIKVKEFYYTGGSFGQSNEENIMLEIYKNGPVVVSLEPDYDFMFYKKGIYHKINFSNWLLKGEKKPEWVKVTHSVLCYGWGENEHGEKYWLIQNSWGDQWGEGGRFRIRRGIDEIGVESLGEAGIPYIEYIDKNDIEQQNVRAYSETI